MAKKHKDVSKRVRNSVVAQFKKLINKYGRRDVWLVTKHHFDVLVMQDKLEESIKYKERELEKLKRMKK
jgi:hypothetical protein